VKRSLILLILSSLVLASCTDPEQQAMIEKHRRQEEQYAADKLARQEAERVAKEQADRNATNPPVAEPSSPPDSPEPAKNKPKVTYYFTSSTERQVVECTSPARLEPCGFTEDDCADHTASYYCQTGVKSWQVTEQ
jgi:hypothetical protein